MYYGAIIGIIWGVLLWLLRVKILRDRGEQGSIGVLFVSLILTFVLWALFGGVIGWLVSRLL